MAYKRFTPEEDAFIAANYLTMTFHAIADHLKRSRYGIRGRLRILGLVLPDHIMKERAAMSRFKPGQAAFNKGMKQSDYTSPESIERSAATRFKKGNLPASAHNEVGKITIRHDHLRRGGKPYKYICLQLGKWRPLHSVNWEKANGKLPKGYCLWFKDGDTMNCELSNLELVTRGENMLRNSASINLPDKIIAGYIAKQGQSIDRELRDEILKHPDLIQAKRTQLLIGRKLKSIESNRNSIQKSIDHG